MRTGWSRSRKATSTTTTSWDIREVNLTLHQRPWSEKMWVCVVNPRETDDFDAPRSFCSSLYTSLISKEYHWQPRRRHIRQICLKGKLVWSCLAVSEVQRCAFQVYVSFPSFSDAHFVGKRHRSISIVSLDLLWQTWRMRNDFNMFMWVKATAQLCTPMNVGLLLTDQPTREPSQVVPRLNVRLITTQDRSRRTTPDLSPLASIPRIPSRTFRDAEQACWIRVPGGLEQEDSMGWLQLGDGGRRGSVAEM